MRIKRRVAGFLAIAGAVFLGAGMVLPPDKSPVIFILGVIAFLGAGWLMF